MKKIVCYGEILWDMLPTGKKPGGAPFNVALRAQALGNQAVVISCIGNDSAGNEILDEMKSHSANTEHIQVSKNYSTSKVLVTLDSTGSASYEIKMPCAWDDIELLEKDIAAVGNSDAFVYGSLIARNPKSQSTLFDLLTKSNFNVFDVNLRPPHYEYKILIKLMNHAHFIKFNDDELFEICAAMGCKEESIESCIKYIAKKTNTVNVCVTLGEKGAVLYRNDQFIYHHGYKIKVADTVGAGDSFLATIISKLINGETSEKAIEDACAIGAIVASKSGANPVITDEEVRRFKSQGVG